MKKLTLLICRLRGRERSYEKLRKQISDQAVEGVEIRTLEDDGGLPIGIKRNSLLHAAEGEYVAFIDDDDRIGDDYIAEVMHGINQGVDCCSLVGEITTDGKDPKIFVHSIDYDTYFEKDGVYYRPPNHLNVIKSTIAKRFEFPRISHGEDTDWAMQIAKSKILKTEYKIKKTIYYYDYKTKK